MRETETDKQSDNECVREREIESGTVAVRQEDSATIRERAFVKERVID